MKPDATAGARLSIENAFLGLSFGFPVAFALWVFHVDFANRIHHYGGGESANQANIACLIAGATWIKFGFIATAVGAILGMIVFRTERLRLLARRLSISLTPVYLLALRSAWGRWELWSDAPATLPAVPLQLPVAATAIPILIAAAAMLFVYRFASRELRPERSGRIARGPVGAAEKDAISDAGSSIVRSESASLAMLHFCLASLALEVAVQLPYYLGATGKFFEALGDFKSLL